MRRSYSMRRFLMLVVFLGIAPAALPAQSVRMEDVGIHGYFTTGTPTRIRVEATNPLSHPTTIDLQIQIHPEPPKGTPIGRIDTFSKSVTLQAGEHRLIDIPVMITFWGKVIVDLEARVGGQHLSSEQRAMEKTFGEGQPVLLLCPNDQICRQAEEKLAYVGADEKNPGSDRYSFIPVSDPPPQWWEYETARSVVLATPGDKLSAEQQLALEGYLRHGGEVFLIESLVGNSSFLAPYRTGKAAGQARRVGLGSLYRFEILGPEVQAFFKNYKNKEEEPRQKFIERFSPPQNAMFFARRRLALNFVFPTFSWLLWSLGIYIVVIGVLNFAILRRMNRQEWGWITTPAIALMFAAGFYFVSSAKRPKLLELDEITTYMLDENSPLAAEHVGLRISSPSRQDVPISVPEDLISIGAESDSFAIDMDEGLSFRQRAMGGEKGSKIDLGPPLKLSVPLLQWSFRDSNYLGLHRFGGSVRRATPTTLINETGQSFRDAVYIDQDLVYLLGAVAPGATIDLGSAERQSHLEAGLVSKDDNIYEWRKPKLNEPFTLVGMVKSWPQPSSVRENSIFLGLSAGPSADAQITGKEFVRRQYAVTIVPFESKP